jgi:hypothetical protein
MFTYFLMYGEGLHLKLIFRTRFLSAYNIWFIIFII